MLSGAITDQMMDKKQGTVFELSMYGGVSVGVVLGDQVMCVCLRVSYGLHNGDCYSVSGVGELLFGVRCWYLYRVLEKWVYVGGYEGS